MVRDRLSAAGKIDNSEDPELIEVITVADGAGALTPVEELLERKVAEEDIGDLNFNSRRTATSNTQQQHDDNVDSIGLPKDQRQEVVPNPAENINSVSTT